MSAFSQLYSTHLVRYSWMNADIWPYAIFKRIGNIIRVCLAIEGTDILYLYLSPLARIFKEIVLNKIHNLTF